VRRNGRPQKFTSRYLVSFAVGASLFISAEFRRLP
jgi:hypothetical protein